MIKKSIAILIILNILIMLNPFCNTKKAYAAPIVGNNALKAVVIGAMEKGGIKFKNATARERAIEAWNMKAYEKWKADEAAGRNKDLWEAFETYKLNPPKPEAIPDKPGFGRILLDSTIYGMAFGIGWDIGSAIVDAYENNKPVPYYDDSLSNLPEGARVKNLDGVSVKYLDWKDSYFFEVRFPDGYQTGGTIAYLNEFDSWSYDFTNFRRSDNVGLVFDFNLHLNKSGNIKTKTTEIYDAEKHGLDILKPLIYEKIPVETEIPDINVPEPLKEVVNDPYAMPTSDPVEIIVPIGDNPYADNPYNNPDDWSNPEPNPEPEPEPNPEPNPESPDKVNWKKLKDIPVTFTNKFPFSLPWDIMHIAKELNVKPEKIKINENFKIGNINIPINIEIPEWIDKFTPLIRISFVIIFIIGLIYGTRSLMGGGV